jgi:hypothetical protein
MTKEEVEATDWSETVKKIATLEDGTLLAHLGANVGILILARAAGDDKTKAKAMIPAVEKMHKLMCEEIKRRGLKHEGMLI